MPELKDHDVVARNIDELEEENNHVQGEEIDVKSEVVMMLIIIFALTFLILSIN